MTPSQNRKRGKTVVLFALSLLGVVGMSWMTHAADDASSDPAMEAAEGVTASEDAGCCKAGYMTPPIELVHR